MKFIKYSVFLILLMAEFDLFSAPETIISNNEVLVYKVHPEKGDPYTSKTVYNFEKKNGVLFYSYIHYDKDHTFKVITDKDAIPRKIIRTNAESSASFTFTGEGSVILVLENNNGITEKNGTFSENVSAENALIARTLDLSSEEKYEFDLIQCDKLPELAAYRMYFQVEGETTVAVKAGNFKCRKVLFSLSGWKGMFYKAYYYISNDEHHYIVKIENMPEGGCSELVKINNSGTN
ncbi:MAG: hypothetical protein JW864_10385 [Spirochaetes bacterium]|nr:hypothetical protein [Spirochaetota bacterium]